MGFLLVMLLVFVVILTLLLGLSVGVALLMTWLLPAVGLEVALLVAVLAVGQAILIFGRVLSALPPALAEVGGRASRRLLSLTARLRYHAGAGSGRSGRQRCVSIPNR